MIDDAALVLVPGPGLQSRPPDQLAWTLATSDVSAWRPTSAVRRFWNLDSFSAKYVLMCLIRVRVDRRIADRGVVGVDESYDFMIIGRAKANGQRATSLGTQVRSVRVWERSRPRLSHVRSGRLSSYATLYLFAITDFFALRIGLEGPNRHMRRMSNR